MSNLDVVAQVKAELLAAGENLDHACGAFKITSTAAFRLNPKADPNGWGLIHSTGNGCTTNDDHYRTDTMMLKDGTVYDCLSMAESCDGLVYPQVGHDQYNIPVWNSTGPQAPENWRPPYDPGILPASGGGESGGGTVPADADAINAHTTAEADRVIAAVTAQGERLSNQMAGYRSEVIDFCEQAGKLLLAVGLLRRRPDEPTEPEP